MKNKERLRKSHRPEETKETQWLNSVSCPGLNPGTEERYKWKAGGTQIMWSGVCQLSLKLPSPTG